MRARYAAGLLIIAVLAMGIVLRLYNHTNVTVRSPDEVIYTWQAKHIAEYNGDAMGSLLTAYNNDKEMWKLPPPTRIGYLWPLSYFMEATGIHDVRVGSYMSLIFSILSLLFLAAFALKYFNGWIALYAVLSMGVSAMDLAVSRRAWQDAVFGGLGFLLVYVTSELVEGKRRVLWSVLFVILGSYYILVKESGAILYALCIAWLFLYLYRQKRRQEAVCLFAFIAAGAACSIGLLAFASGGLGQLLGVIRHIRDGMPANVYAIEYQTGPWYNIPFALFIVSPLNMVFCLVGISAFIAGRKDKGITPEIASVVIFILLTFVSAAVIAPYCQNLRYITPIYALFYLVGGMGAWYIYGFLKSRFSGIALKAVTSVMVAVILCSASADYGYFRKAFIKQSALDLSIKILKERPRL